MCADIYDLFIVDLLAIYWCDWHSVLADWMVVVGRCGPLTDYCMLDAMFLLYNRIIL